MTEPTIKGAWEGPYKVHVAVVDIFTLQEYSDRKIADVYFRSVGNPMEGKTEFAVDKEYEFLLGNHGKAVKFFGVGFFDPQSEKLLYVQKIDIGLPAHRRLVLHANKDKAH